MSRGRDCSSSRNFASNSTSEMPNAPAVTLFGAPNAIIARTKRRSASLKFETLLLSSAASTFLSAATRDVMAFRFRPDPGLAPPTDSSGFRHFQPFELLATKRCPILKGTRANRRTVAKSDSRRRALTPHGLAVLCLGRVAVRSSSIVRGAT